MAKQVATPGVRIGNQDDGGLFRGTHGFPLRTWRTEQAAPGMTGGYDTARGHTRV
ncbi:response regulator [Pseudomonas aeruginosa]|nr:response regulator [Pseudomonas aeruginosa]MDE5499980.1 response regulator [Pseudomonas sp. 4B]OWK95387.1 response regulator [Pseudomonas aeruginosa 148]ASC95197.1 response regulator [Pseudomonas aeruginosa]ASD01346.1 response regulator [Pseudomonas aeruginosa]